MYKKWIAVGVVFFLFVAGSTLLLTKNNSRPDQLATEITEHPPSYSLQSDSSGKMYAANSSNEYSFSIVDEAGKTLKEFAVTHTKLMHVIIVRKDLAYFQHVHPEFDSTTGMFTLKDLLFPADGTYRIFADFALADASSSTTLSEDISVGDTKAVVPQAIGTEERTKTFDDYQVTLATHGAPTSGAENMLMFSLSQNGQPITDLEPYLGALGHAVILRAGTLDFIHAHPMEDMAMQQNGLVSFMVTFPQAGTYKVFTQFQRAGKVSTTDFVVKVIQGTGNASSMNHMMH